MIRLVTFGRGGDTVYDDDGSRTTGYGNPERPHAAEGKDIPDGTPVIDTRKATETDVGFSWVFKGPMCDPKIPDGECDACPEPSALLVGGLAEQARAGGGNGFVGLLGLQAVSRARKEARGPLDCVSVAEYVRGWREHGADIGVYRGGFIVWECDGAA